jgi:rRNA maturation RNase YbeY
MSDMAKATASTTRPRRHSQRTARSGKAARSNLVIRVTNRSGAEGGRALRAPRRVVLKTVLSAAASGAKQAAVDIIWVHENEMKTLNKRFHNRKGTTDVLAFEDGDIDPETGSAQLGEIICNLELARRAAREHGNSAEAEAVLYATHGLLHLLGENDKAPDGRRRMRTVESAALAVAGLEVRGGEWDKLWGEHNS